MALMWLMLLSIVVGTSVLSTSQQRLFSRMMLNDQRWQGSPIQANSFLACSLKCHLSDCLLYAWVDNECFHGHPVFTWERANSESEVFINEQDHRRLSLQDEVTTKGAQSDVHPRMWTFKNWWFTFVPVLHTYETAKTICGKVGGYPLVLHDEEVFNFYRHVIKKTAVGWVSAPWIGLQPNTISTDGCMDEECEDKLAWEDGQSYLHQPYFGCTKRTRANVGKSSAFFFRYEQRENKTFCGRTMKAPYYILQEASTAAVEKLAVCQIELQ